MTKKQIKLYRIALTASSAVALVSAVLILTSVFSSFDLQIGHFAVGAVLPTVSYALAALAVVPAAVAGLMIRFDKSEGGKCIGITDDRRSMLSTAVRIFAAILLFASFAASLPTLGGYAPDRLSEKIAATVSAMLASFSFIAIILEALAKKRGAGVALLSLMPILWGIAAMLRVYFGNTLALNSPIRSETIIALCFAVVFFVGEARFCNLRQTLAVHVFVSVASVSSISLILPTVFLTLSGELKTGISVFEACALLAIWMIAVTRAIGLASGAVAVTGKDEQNTSGAGENK